jgi:NDP-sugar pyrophosphorylase family protein
MLERVARRLIAAGTHRLIVNVHHHADQVVRFLEEQEGFGAEIRLSVEETEPLETGGGLRAAASLFEKDAPFFLHNVDVVSDLDLRAMYEAHVRAAARAETLPRSGPLLATLAVREPATALPLLADEVGFYGIANLRTGWRRRARAPAGETRELGFCGIHVVSPEIHDRMTEEGAFPIWDPYFRLVAEGWRLVPYEIGEATWLEVGTLERLERARERLEEG